MGKLLKTCDVKFGLLKSFIEILHNTFIVNSFVLLIIVLCIYAITHIAFFKLDMLQYICKI